MITVKYFKRSPSVHIHIQIACERYISGPKPSSMELYYLTIFISTPFFPQNAHRTRLFILKTRIIRGKIILRSQKRESYLKIASTSKNPSVPINKTDSDWAEPINIFMDVKKAEKKKNAKIAADMSVKGKFVNSRRRKSPTPGKLELHRFYRIDFRVYASVKVYRNGFSCTWWD